MGFFVFTFSLIKGSPEILWDTEFMKFHNTYTDSAFRYTKMNSVHGNFHNIIIPTVIPNLNSHNSTVKKYTLSRIGVYSFIKAHSIICSFFGICLSCVLI